MGVRHGLVQLKVYIEQGEQAAREWLRTTGYKTLMI